MTTNFRPVNVQFEKGGMLIVRVSCIFRPLVLGKVTKVFGMVPAESLNFVECAFSGTVFQRQNSFGEFLNLFCAFSLLSVCVRICPDEFGRVSVGLCSMWIWNLLLCRQNCSGRTRPRAVVEVRLGSEV